MPLTWDVMPVSLIYYLHKYNFEDKPLQKGAARQESSARVSTQGNEVDNYRESDLSYLSENEYEKKANILKRKISLSP